MEAIGTAEEPITFTSNREPHETFRWGRIWFPQDPEEEIVFKNVVIEHSSSGLHFDRIITGTVSISESTFRNSGDVLIASGPSDVDLGGNFSLTDSVFMGNSGNSLIRIGGRNLTVKNNTITNNIAANLIVLFGCESGEISGNLITENSSPMHILVNSGSDNLCVQKNTIKNNTILDQEDEPPGVVKAHSDLSNNNIYDNNAANSLVVYFGTGEVDVTNNYWGTDDPNVISDLIYDYYDDFNYAEAIYEPIATEPIAGAP